ncbi:MAG: hypothetical protein J3R72DRAFT_517093 [Linnemannia gamsii]|nr:MAG: hypothetical protein J3R72DRAFT_517093 [Linnemannia gamsii]
MSDSTFIIAFFGLLFAGKVAIMVQYFRNKRRSAAFRSSSSSSSSSTSPNSSMSNIETGPEVLIEDPMTQRLLLAGGAVEEPREISIRIPPPAYTIKDEHLEFENDPPPPSFADAVPSTLSSSCSNPPKARRKLSRAGSSGSHSNHSHRRWSRHQLFRYHPSSMDNSNHDNDDVSSDHAADTVSRSTSGVDRTAVEPTVIRIPNVARWVAESRRDAYRHYASPLSEPYSFGFVSTYSDSDNYHYNLHQDLQQHGSSTAGSMRILLSMGVLYPSVVVHM